MTLNKTHELVSSNSVYVDTTQKGKKDMQIGILGTGRMGVRLAAMFADAGHTVVLGSRDLSRAERIASGLRRTNITACSYEKATNAPIVLPAMFIRDGLFDQLEPLRPALQGKLLIDISNPFNDDYSDFERMTLLSGQMGQRYGLFPRMKLQVARRPVAAWKR